MEQSILIVDDEKDIVSMLNQYFYKIGYVVYTAINGKEALNAITKNPDIILLDINMPDMNGFTVCESIRNYVSCPIIFLTARVEDCDKIKGCRNKHFVDLQQLQASLEKQWGVF